MINPELDNIIAADNKKEEVKTMKKDWSENKFAMDQIYSEVYEEAKTLSHMVYVVNKSESFNQSILKIPRPHNEFHIRVQGLEKPYQNVTISDTVSVYKYDPVKEEGKQELVRIHEEQKHCMRIKTKDSLLKLEREREPNNDVILDDEIEIQ